jgi:hypothetical protein
MDKPNNDRENNKIYARSERIILAKTDGDGNKTNILPFSLHILQGVTTKSLRFARTRPIYVFRVCKPVHLHIFK